MSRYSRTASEIVDELFEKAIANGDCLECHLRPSVDREGRERHYVNVDGRTGIKWRVTRLVWHVRKGPIANDLWVLHTCDNGKCINLDHLFLGTAQENTNDMIKKSRASFVHPRTDHVNREPIKELHAQGLDRFEIARRLYISPSTVWNYTSPKGPYYE